MNKCMHLTIEKNVLLVNMLSDYTFTDDRELNGVGNEAGVCVLISSGGSLEM